MNAKRADLCRRTESRAESTLVEDERLPFVAAEVFELRPGLLCGVDVHGNAALSEGREGRRFGEPFEPGSDRREPRQTGVAASALSDLPHGSGVSYRFASQKRCPLTSHRGRRTTCRMGVHGRHPPRALVPPTSAATAAGVLRHPLATPEMLPRTNRLGLRLTCAGGGSAA